MSPTFIIFVSMTLDTPTSSMSIIQLRQLVNAVIIWCKRNMGTNPHRGMLRFRVMKQNNKIKKYYGVYFWEDNQLIVYYDNCPTVKYVIKTVIHEYTHYLQNMDLYLEFLSVVGYKKHPQEIEARESEQNYSRCWKSIKQKRKRDEKLFKSLANRLHHYGTLERILQKEIT
jgi:hypothetical protein